MKSLVAKRPLHPALHVRRPDEPLDLRANRVGLLRRRLAVADVLDREEAHAVPVRDRPL